MAFRFTRLVATAALAATLSSIAAAQTFEFDHPATLDRGIVQELRLEGSSPFVVIFQASVSPTFSQPYNFPLLQSQPGPNGEEANLSFRTPWDIDDFLTEIHFRAVYIDLVTNKLGLEDSGLIEVGQGERTYQSVWDNGLFAVEFEWEQPTDDWAEESSQDGYTGSGYLIWNGSNHYDNQDNGHLEYKVNVEEAGLYGLRLHSYHEDGHLHNDIWVAVDGGSYIKVYCRTDDEWSWHSNEDPGHEPYFVDLDVGVHTIQFAARSQYFHLNRFHLYNRDFYRERDADDISIEASTYTYED